MSSGHRFSQRAFRNAYDDRGGKLAASIWSKPRGLRAGFPWKGKARPGLSVSFALVGLVSAFLLVFLSACAGAAPEPTKAPAETKPAAPATVAKPAAAPTEAKPAPTAAPPAQPTPQPKAAEPTKAPEAVKPLEPRVPVKLAIVGISPDAGTLTALERGYFKEEGLDIELIQLGNAADINTGIATGELHFASYAIVPAFYNTVARGIDIRIVAEKAGVDTAGLGGAALVVRKDLFDSGAVKDVSMLKGKTIAVNAQQTTSEMYIDLALRKAGLKIGDVNITQVPFPDMLAAMANKAIDAAWEVEPFVAIGKMRGIATPLIDIYGVYPGHVTYILIASPVFTQKNPEAARRVVTAHLRGQRDYYDAFQKGKTDKAPIISYLIKHTALKDQALYGQLMMHTVNPNGRVDPSVVARDQDYFFERGWVKQKIDVTKALDMQYVDYAVKRLGEYK